VTSTTLTRQYCEIFSEITELSSGGLGASVLTTSTLCS